jgi:hypothetical protein
VSKKPRHIAYTLLQTIDELDGWLNRSKSFYPIDTAIAAQHWLDEGPRPIGAFPMSFTETKAELGAWLANEDPELPMPIGEAVFYWLRQIERTRSPIPDTNAKEKP